MILLFMQKVIEIIQIQSQIQIISLIFFPGFAQNESFYHLRWKLIIS